MSDFNKQDAVSSQTLPPVEIRRGAYARLTILEVEVGELEQLAQGSPDSLYLNFAIFLLSVAITAVVALLTLPDRVSASSATFVVFVVIATVGFIVGIFLLLLWLKKRRSVSNLVQRIKNRLPPEGIQESGTLPEDSNQT